MVAHAVVTTGYDIVFDFVIPILFYNLQIDSLNVNNYMVNSISG
jgi:hypothetical protein